MNDDFGDRMKAYEAVETHRRFDPSLPIYARIDGRSFSKFTRGMDRPFDERMADAMRATAAELVEQTHARLAYVQSDEISLVWLRASPEGSIFFDGKVQKMVSVLASIAAARFGAEVILAMPEKASKLPHFDCRVFSLPSLDEGSNAFLWRALDARKNAVSMVAQHHFSHRELHGKGQADMRSMLLGIGVDFETYPARFKQGAFLRRVTRERMLSEAEMDRIPERHRPSGPVLRSEIADMDWPPFWRIANRNDVVFNDADPGQTAAADAVAVLEAEVG